VFGSFQKMTVDTSSKAETSIIVLWTHINYKRIGYMKVFFSRRREIILRLVLTAVAFNVHICETFTVFWLDVGDVVNIEYDET